MKIAEIAVVNLTAVRTVNVSKPVVKKHGNVSIVTDVTTVADRAMTVTAI